MKTARQTYKPHEDTAKKQGDSPRKGSRFFGKLRVPIFSKNNKSIGPCPLCGKIDASFSEQDNVIECNNCGFFIDRSYEGINPLPEWNLVRRKDNYDEWIGNWKEESAPYGMDPLEYIQMNDVRKYPELREVILDPALSNLVIDVWDYIKWNNRFSDHDLSEFGNGLFYEYASKVVRGEEGRNEFMEDLFHGEYDRDNRMEAFIVRDFNKLQKKYGGSEWKQ